MKKILLLFIIGGFGYSSFAQIDPAKNDLERFNRPTVSPRAEVSQKIGLDFIKINYARPNVRGRKIFGGLLKYNKIWRVGADNQTVIDFQNEYIIDGKIILKGEYAIFVLPEPDKWTIFFNKDINGWGYYTYKEEDNVYEFEIPVTKSKSFTETFTIGFMNTSLNQGELFFEWENILVKLPITISTNHREEVERNIDLALGLDKGILLFKYYMASDYYFLEEKNYEKALNYIETAINGGNKSFPAYFLQGEILYALERKEEAIKAVLNAKKSLPEFLNPEWEVKIEQALKKWEEK